jgi:uncharacterized protein YjbI with pentapeptide repeats
MRYVKDSPLEIGYRVGQLRPPQHSLTVVVKGTFDPAAGDPAPFVEDQAPVSGETYVDDDVERPLATPSDLALFKPAGELLVIGKAWSGAKPASAVMASFRVGPIAKRFAVFGDRRWKGAFPAASDPVPFTEMPLDLGRSYGGPGFAANPFGSGRDDDRLPNLERPERLIGMRGDRPEPVVIGPLPMTWPARLALAGTYDQAYMKQRWPWLPADFDFRFFQEAPPDQRLASGYWRGDERFEIDGLHPSGAVRSRLPHVAPRVLVSLATEGEESFHEVVLRLDTVVWDGASARLLLTWRGLIEVPSASLDEVGTIFVAHDDLRGPARTGEELRRRCAELLADEEREEEEAEGEDPPDERATVPSPRPSTRADAVVDPLEDVGPSSEPLELRALVVTRVAADRALSELDLTGADLSGLDLSGRDLHGAILRRANLAGARLCDAVLAGAVLAEANLAGADLTGADLREADVSYARADGIVLDRACADGASFTETSLIRADLTGLSAHEATFAGANLAGAAAAGAIFDSADLDRARLERMRACDASFVEASLEGAHADRADFSRARMKGLRGEALHAPGARFTAIDAEGAFFEGANLSSADFTLAHLPGADFSRAVLSNAVLDGCVLRSATFDDGNLFASTARRCDLIEASFVGADLSSADLSWSVLFGANLWRTRTYELRLEGANVKRTQLEKGAWR